MPLVLRQDKGANLTAAEVDGNFTFLQGLIEDLQLHGTPGVSVVSFTVTGGTFRVNLSDGSNLGPYPLPIAMFRWTEEWQANTDYSQLDFFSVTGVGLFFVVADHTSGVTFDPNQTTGAPNYNPVLVKVFGYISPQTLLPVGNTDEDFYTISESDNGSYLRFTSDTPVTVYVPANDLFAIPTGFSMTLRQAGAGQITLFPLGDASTEGTEGGVAPPVVNTPESLSSRTQHSTITLAKVAADEWDLSGDIALAV